MPITWRSVGATVSPPSPQLLTAGQQGLQRSLAAIGDVIQQQQKVNNENFDTAKQNNTNAFLDQVTNASVDQLSNPDFVANLNSSAQGQGQGIDQNVARTAVAKELASKQQQSTVAQAYKDDQAIQAATPVIDDLRNKALAGDRSAVNQGIADLHLPTDAEGKVAQQFNSLLDDYDNRQRAARGETRAIAAQNLSMQAQRENMAYTALQRQDLVEQRSQNNLGTSAAYEGFQAVQNAKDASRGVLQNIAGSLDLPRDQNGFADMSKMTPDQKTGYQDAIKKSGLQDNLSDTDVRRNVINMVREAGGDARAIQSALNTTDLLSKVNNLAPADAAQAQSSIDAANQSIDQLAQARTQKYQNDSSRNPFVTPDADPVKSANNVLDAVMKNKDINLSSTDAQKNLRDALLDLTTNGMTVSVNGQEKKIAIPEQILRSALVGTDLNNRSWTPSNSENPATNIRKAVEDILSTDGTKQQLEQAETIRSDFSKDILSYQNDKLKKSQEIVNRYQGGKIDPNPILTNALRQR